MLLRILSPIPGVAAIFSLLLLSGCIFREVTQQQAKLDALCTISGTIETPDAGDPPVVVLLVRIDDARTLTAESVHLADHFVRDGAGRWIFVTGPGTYGLAAFEDRDPDLVYRPGDPFLQLDRDRLIECAPGRRFDDIALSIPPDGRPAFEGELDIAALQARTPDDQLALSLGALTATGEVASLDDPRFDPEMGSTGLWRPFDFLADARPGVYFLQPYAADKVPVLFVHGANGTPRNFAFLVDHMDRSRFQPWVYFYPSGVRLQSAAAHLDQTVAKLRRRYGFEKLIVVAHSMGGLVSRAFVLRNGAEGGVEIPLLVTIATPWDGHAAAQLGVDRAPAVVRSWYDMAPGSPFLTEIFHTGEDPSGPRTRLPDGTAHHLIFAFHRDSASFGPSSDGAATVVSQLRQEAQDEAVRLYGFDDTHVGVLSAPPVSDLLNRLLAEAGD